MYRTLKRILHLSIAGSLLLSLIPPQLVFAVSNKLYVTPDVSQMNVGTSFTINVRSFAASDQAIGTVSGTLLYSASLLQVTEISTAGSAYGAPTISQGYGTVTFSGSRNPGLSGASQIFAVTFRAQSAGAASVGFNGESRVNSSPTTYSGGNFTITSPAPTTSPVPTPAPIPTRSPAPRPTPPTRAPTATPQQPTTTEPEQTPEPLATPDPTGVIDGVITSPSYTSTTITWSINAPNASSTIAYGSQSSQLDKNGTVEKKDDGSFTTTITGLIPGEKYFYSITGGGTGTPTGTYSSSILTAGYPVVITATENNIAVKGAQVQIGSSSYTTRADGKITVGLAAGDYTGKITTNTATLAINLTVAKKTIPVDGSAPESQSFSFNLTSSVLEAGPGTSTSVLSFIGILFGGSVIMIIGFLIFMRYRRHKFENSVSSYSSAPTVIIQDGYDWRQNAPEEQTPPQTLTENTTGVPTSPYSHNSVHLSEEEPLDMFEQAKLADTQPSVDTPTSPPASTEQTPN